MVPDIVKAKVEEEGTYNLTVAALAMFVIDLESYTLTW
jgi:hypothetical protein